MAATVLRPRLELKDLLVLIAIMCAATLFAFEYDFFETAHDLAPSERRITMAEFFALTGLLIVSLIGFSIWRIRQERHHLHRRLAAESEASVARYQAMHDPLTGLPNRRAFMELIAASLSDPALVPQTHALILIDLNGFKAVNDRFGHPVGDQLLQVIARRLCAAGDGTSVAARLGGDEFALFCPRVEHPQQVQTLAQDVVLSIETPARIEEQVHRVGAGVGIAFHPTDALTERDLFRLADAALYRAKGSGRSMVCCYRELEGAAH